MKRVYLHSRKTCEGEEKWKAWVNSFGFTWLCKSPDCYISHNCNKVENKRDFETTAINVCFGIP